MRRRSLLLAVLAFYLPQLPAIQRSAALPEDRGTAGILQSLERLPVYAHVLWTQAHPDDESGSTLTWLARGRHVRTALFCLTRGDGGQNVLGNEKYEAIGVVRTGEMLGACEVYGVEPYFSTVFEFGFSKSSDETLQKWGHEETLEEIVRFIRRWKPAVMFSAFDGSPGDGHGHHRASGLLSREAFAAAGDPKRFPEHAKLGLEPWKPKKLYVRAGRRGEARDAVEIPVGTYDPVLGRSYREIGAEGYSHHRSQGNAASWAEPGPAFDRYVLASSNGTAAPETQSGVFDGIDTSLRSVLELAGPERNAAAALEPDLVAAQSAAEEALRQFHPRRPADAAPAVLRGRAALAAALKRLSNLPVSRNTRIALESALEEKLTEFDEAAAASLSVCFEARTGNPNVVPGEKFRVTTRLLNGGTVALDRIEKLEFSSRLSPGITNARSGEGAAVAPGGVSVGEFDAAFPVDAPPTQPFWYRKTRDDNRYATRAVPDVFAPFGPPELEASVEYTVAGTRLRVTAPVRSVLRDQVRGSSIQELQIHPRLSVRVRPETLVQPIAQRERGMALEVTVVNNDPSGTRGSLRLAVPEGWKVEPAASVEFQLPARGSSATMGFRLGMPPSARPGDYRVEAVAGSDAVEYRDGYRVISYPGNWTRYLYAPAVADVRAIDVKIAPGLSIGYVDGAGDEVPDALRQLGCEVSSLSDKELLTGDLSRYAAIVTGVRAYNVREAVRTANPRLMKYAEEGGLLIVQYNWPFRGAAGGSFPYAPFPLEVSADDRITVEDSPVRVLQPDSPVLLTPNRIGPADFEGWVQERGLYFASSWDPRYTTFFSGNDPGESPKDGGLLIARVGKGRYVYTSFAWFRQLPAGVPGAHRLFANILSLGK